MIFKFKGELYKIMNQITDYLADRDIPVITKQIEYGKMQFIIRKIGISTLTFSTDAYDPNGQSPTVIFSLEKEEISWWHRSKIELAKAELKKMVTELGGKVV